MKLIYYASEKGNVGDELNFWLWEKFFGKEIIDDYQDVAFLGIGSILLENSWFLEEASKYKHKIIFGTGVRSINEKLLFDESWNISFLRGPFSSLKINNNIDNYISDAAYALPLVEDYSKYLDLPKKYKVSVIPYFKSLDKAYWENICKEFGWNLITTETKDVDWFLKEVASSEFVISEAMHGAILADILRVPWKRLKFHSHVYEGMNVSEFKWEDWLYSVGIRFDNAIDIGIRKKKKVNFITQFYYKKRNTKRMIKAFKNLDFTNFNLSDDSIFKEIVLNFDKKRSSLINYLKTIK